MPSEKASPQPRRIRRKVDGVLLLDKPEGMSSNAALQRARALFQAEKAGHTGTLDPLASGLLPVCLGEATKFSADLLDADKTYRARVRLGMTTTTGDAEGAVLEIRPVCCDAARVQEVLAAFTGEMTQVPPMYSALKREGRPLYELARQGVTVEREARQIRIHRLELLNVIPAQAGIKYPTKGLEERVLNLPSPGNFAPGYGRQIAAPTDNSIAPRMENSVGDATCVPPQALADDTPWLEVEVCCSKGTYIRVLAEDIGEALGCGAHLAGLRRIAVGDLTLTGARSLPELEQLAADGALMDALLPVDYLLRSLSAVFLDEGMSARFGCGNPVRVDKAGEPGTKIRVYAGERELLGVGEVKADGLLYPRRLLAR
ncbi:MAG: tRNA pseudouridine(55) synthase TruB [Zoogloeaceae bacterium]|jgi:tRNA pseudouridine55 synthase|nr:tRNA pseudouridine(55) synthase TruB [Zoogloeaceae bacterium]